MDLELHKVLHMLALRENQKLGAADYEDYDDYCWVEETRDPRDLETRYICLICQSILGPNYEAHGIWHLKQKNLLPFI